jgi:hypothetical protein
LRRGCLGLHRRPHLLNYSHAANNAVEDSRNNPFAGQFIFIYVIGENQRLQNWSGHMWIRTEVESAVSFGDWSIVADDCSVVDEHSAAGNGLSGLLARN